MAFTDVNTTIKKCRCGRAVRCICKHYMWEHCFFHKEPTRCIGHDKKTKATCLCDSFKPIKHIIDGKT